MSNYFVSDEFEGLKPFKCYVCRKMLIVHIEGEYAVRLLCPRCKTKIYLETEKSVPVGLMSKHLSKTA